ncbi:MAG: hypothetical protein JRE23_16960 [Deltaproteobacteria bacterium]|nr:hypothetical protein [Deltaproteobacteria bacterium]
MIALDFINLVSGQLGWGTQTGIATLDTEGEKILIISNTIISSMQNDKTWPELRADGEVMKTAPRSIGAYCAITYGSVELTSTEEVFASTDVGKLIQVGSYKTVYRIATYVDLENVTLETPWRDEDVTLQTAVIGQDRYSLPSDLDMLLSGKMVNLSTGTEIREVDPTEMRAIRSANGLTLLQNEPEYFTIHGLDSSGNKQVHFDKVSDAEYALEYDYQADHPTLTADADPILYPDKYVMYIADSVIAKLQRDVENSQVAMQTSQDSLKEAMRVGSNPNNSRDRMRLRVRGNKLGAYRRR